jgi:hypothetical protein
VRHPGIVATVLSAPLLLFGAASCGDDGETVSDGDVDREWVTVTDSASGISVELPEQTEPQPQQVPTPDGQTLSATIYMVELGDAAAVSATVFEIPAGTQTFDLEGSVQGSASNIGGTIESTSATSVDGRAALDAEIAFTHDGFDGRDLLQVVTVDETYVLQLQALGRAEDDNVDELFERVTDGVQLP